MSNLRKNAYVCQNLHVTVTQDLEKGTTPMFINCPTCGEPKTREQANLFMAGSLMYRINQSKIASHEWFMPTEKDLAAMAVSMSEWEFRATAEHVKQGGLLMRKIEGTEVSNV